MEERKESSSAIFTIDVDHSFVNTVKQKLNDFEHMQMSVNKFSICRVPAPIRKGKEKYYEPAIIAIGPYHRHHKHLQPMEAHKLKFLKDFLARNTKNTLEDYIQSLRAVEHKVRKCYFDYIDLESEEFLMMLLLDGCFIIEYFLKRHFENYGEEMFVGGNGWLHVCISNDLYLLENQIPFLVIKVLSELLVRGIEAVGYQKEAYDRGIVQIITSSVSESFDGNIDDIDHLLGLACLGMSPQMAGNVEVKKDYKVSIGRAIHGVFVCLLNPLWFVLSRIFGPLSCLFKDTSSNESTRIPCASKLVEYGIKLKSRGEKYPMTHIAYNDGVLEIPSNIKIGEENKCFLFNVLAFEQCNIHDPKKLKLTTYFQFMDFLIDTPKDVEILQECGIIVTYLKSSEETTLFFNQLNDHAYLNREDHYLVEMYAAINKFCDSKWHRYKANLKRDYFSSPWAILSLTAAIILLILTLVSTFYTVYPYYKPSKH